jgi:hypothetical protein
MKPRLCEKPSSEPPVTAWIPARPGLLELRFKRAVQAGQRSSRQPTAAAGQDPKERPQLTCHGGDVRPEPARTGRLFLPRLTDFRARWCSRRLGQRPQARLVLRCRDLELTRVCRHGRTLAGRLQRTAKPHPSAPGSTSPLKGRGMAVPPPRGRCERPVAASPARSVADRVFWLPP